MPAKKATAKKTTTNSPKAAKARTASTQAKSKAGDKEVSLDRRTKANRRDEIGEEVAATQPQPTFERREKVQRRRQIDPTTCERDYSVEEVAFMNAMDDYKRKNGRMFPTCSEVLEVIRDLGYVQLTPAELATVRPEPIAEPEAADNTQNEFEDSDELETAEMAF